MPESIVYLIGRAVAVFLGIGCAVAQYFVLLRIVRSVAAGVTPILKLLLFAALPLPLFVVDLIFIDTDAILWTAGAALILLVILAISKYRRSKGA